MRTTNTQQEVQTELTLDLIHCVCVCVCVRVCDKVLVLTQQFVVLYTHYLIRQTAAG